MRRRKGISVYAIRDMRIDRLIITHPDEDHVSWLRVPHHGTLSATSGVGSVLVYLDESGGVESQATSVRRISPALPSTEKEPAVFLGLPGRGISNCYASGVWRVLGSRVLLDADHSIAGRGRMGFAQETGVFCSHLESLSLKCVKFI
jgi:hypothetical protein